MDSVLSVAKACDTTQLDLSAAEGFLLSRIDGLTPWRFLRQIGGLPVEQVDACLERWLDAGWIEEIGGAAGGSERSAGAPESAEASHVAQRAAAEPAIVIDEGALDEGLDLDLDTQRRILEFEAGLDRPYHVLLGVEPGADPKAVKRAYFKLSKEFHPDRYFRKEIGAHTARLERIFKKILEAHEILSDPELRTVENQPNADASVIAEAAAPDPPAEATVAVGGPTQAAPDRSGGAAGEGASEQARAGATKPRPLTKLERLKQRMPFKINHAALAARRARAYEIFRAAQVSQQAGRLQEAEASIRIAISFDPARAEFKEALGSLRILAAGERASRLLAKPLDRMSDAELYEVLRLLDEVLPYRPHDPELNERAARVCLQLGKLDAAAEYVDTLLERCPEASAAHTLSGRIRKGCGDLAEAVVAFERALKYDPENLEARRALAAVRIGARDAARGGR